MSKLGSYLEMTAKDKSVFRSLYQSLNESKHYFDTNKKEIIKYLEDREIDMSEKGDLCILFEYLKNIIEA